MESLSPSGARLLRAGALEIDLDRCTVWVQGASVELTSKECKLLVALLEAKGEVVSRGLLLERVWGSSNPSEIESRTVSVHIHRLRQKLGPEGRHIITVKNVGYRYDISFEWIKFGT